MTPATSLPIVHCSGKGSVCDKARLAYWLSAQNWPRDKLGHGGDEASLLEAPHGIKKPNRPLAPPSRAGYQNLSILLAL